METNSKIKSKSTFERKLLYVLSFLFVGLMLAAWAFSMNMRNALIEKNSTANVDAQALIEIEKIRNLINSQDSNSLDFFLLGSTSLYEEQKKEKQSITESLARFEKQYSLSVVPEVIKNIETLRLQQQEFFEQGMDFRAKQTESKIVGQFYRSKTAAPLEKISKALDEIVTAHHAEFERRQAEAILAAQNLEARIPEGMTIFTAVILLIFAGMLLLVIRLLRQRSIHYSERARLYQAAQDAVHTAVGLRSAVGHDFVEPVAAIKQASAVIKNAHDAAALVQGADLAASSAQIIEDRVKDILDQTRAEHGKLNLRVEQIPIDAILDEAQLILEPLAKQKDIRLEFIPVNPPVLAFMDRERVIRVLANLVGNAIKFSPKHSKISVKVRSDQQFAFVTVKDSGPGIPEKQLAEVFENFWQSRKTADQGPGIGLAVVKTIIEAHRGNVTVESHVGRGSTFTFSLPRRRPAGALVKKPAPPPIKIAPKSSPTDDATSPV